MIENRKLLAVMFTDIVGYTNMTAKNERQTIAQVELTNKKLRVLVTNHNGKWIQRVGDGTLSTFESAFDALICAIKVQKAFSKKGGTKLRIGIHIGDLVVKGANVWGSGVNIASRIESFAKHGEIAVSHVVKESLASHPSFQFTSTGPQLFKGVPEPIEVFLLDAIEVNLNDISHARTLMGFNRKSLIRSTSFALVCLLALASYFYNVNPASIRFHVLPESSGMVLDEAYNTLREEIKLNLQDASAVEFINESTQYGSLARSGEKVQLITSGHTQSFSNVEDAYTHLYDILKSIIASQLHLEEQLRESLVLYFDVLGELELSNATVNNADSVIRKAQTLLMMSPDNGRFKALLCRALLGKMLVQNNSLSELRDGVSDVCLSLVSEQEASQGINFALSQYYMTLGELELASTFVNKLTNHSMSWYFMSGMLLYNQGDLIQAKEIFNNAKEVHGFDSISIRLALGLIEYDLGNFEEATAVFEDVLVRNPNVPLARERLATTLFSIGKLEEANRYFSEINVSSPSADSLMNQGTALYFLGRYRDAARVYESALKIIPDDYLAIGNYADALYVHEDTREQAKQFYNNAIIRAVELLVEGSDDSYIVLDLAHYYSQLGQFERADEFFLKFKDNNPDSEYYYYFRAISFSQRGDTDNAKAYKALALKYGYPQQYVENTPALGNII